MGEGLCQGASCSYSAFRYRFTAIRLAAVLWHIPVLSLSPLSCFRDSSCFSCLAVVFCFVACFALRCLLFCVPGLGSCVLSPPRFSFLSSACLLCAPLPVPCLRCFSSCFSVVCCGWLSLFPPSFPSPRSCVWNPKQNKTWLFSSDSTYPGQNLAFFTIDFIDFVEHSCPTRLKQFNHWEQVAKLVPSQHPRVEFSKTMEFCRDPVWPKEKTDAHIRLFWPYHKGLCVCETRELSHEQE